MSKNMKQTNQTMVTYFILKGVSDFPELHLPFFLIILLIYLLCLGGNITILILVCLDAQLHTPMYFFLCNLSLIDLSSTTVTLHKSLLNFISGDNRVSLLACLAQMYAFTSLESAVLLILTAMSYDRYVAICKPLHYHIIMNRRVCALLAAVCWGLAFLEIIPTVWLVSEFTCFTSNIINYFFCDAVPLIELTCSDTSLLELDILIEGGFIVCVTPFILTFISYVYIIITILKIRSSLGRRKAFYTCSSHLTVVIILYLTILCLYLTPTSMDTIEFKKLFSLFNTVAGPILNPLIYSLKNKDVKAALRRQLKLSKVTL